MYSYGNTLSATFLISWSYVCYLRCCYMENYVAPVTCEWMNEWMSFKHWENDTDRGIPKGSELTIVPMPLIHNQSHTDCSGIQPGPHQWAPWDTAHLRTVSNIYQFRINLNYYINTRVVTKLRVVVSESISRRIALNKHELEQRFEQLCLVYRFLRPLSYYKMVNFFLFALNIKWGPIWTDMIAN